MSYTGKLFGLIPYSIRDGEIPSYSDAKVESMLSTHYGSVFAPMIYVKNVFHDNKNNGGGLSVDYFINDGGKDYQWFGEVNGDQEDGIALQFQNVPATKQEIDYAYQLFLGLENHFLKDKQLTILQPEQNNEFFNRDEQIAAYQSAKDFIQKNKVYIDAMINNDTPARVSILIRAHLAGISFDLTESVSDILDKLEKNVKTKNIYVQKPPYGKSLYDECLKTANFVDLFDKRIEDFMDRNNLILDVFETNPQYAIRSAFEHWAMSEYASNYSDPWEGFDKFFEDNKNNSDYFKKQENIVKHTCKELGITQKELADKLGASEGTIRNWSSSNELPQWAINFIEVLKENQKNKEIADTAKKLI